MIEKKREFFKQSRHKTDKNERTVVNGTDICMLVTHIYHADDVLCIQSVWVMKAGTLDLVSSGTVAHSTDVNKTYLRLRYGHFKCIQATLSERQ